MENQEYLLHLSLLEQEANKFEEKLRIIEQQIQEMKTLHSSLDEISLNKKGLILSGLGKGVYLETEVKSKDLFVNVGSDAIIKKTIPETKKIIEEQIKSLDEGKTEIINQILSLQKKTEELVEKAKKAYKK